MKPHPSPDAAQGDFLMPNLASKKPLLVKHLEALLEKARTDLGDDHPDHNTVGKNTRPAGYVENAKILHGKPD